MVLHENSLTHYPTKKKKKKKSYCAVLYTL
jgi:hypothetical protein